MTGSGRGVPVAAGGLREQLHDAPNWRSAYDDDDGEVFVRPERTQG